PTTLIEDRLELDLDGIAVHLIYVGPAHTAGDVVVHLPAARVVFTGDVLFRLCTPVGWEGTYARWIAALDEIVALDPAVVVPGHGPLSGVEGPREMQAYLRYVRAEAKRGFDAGLPALEARGGAAPRRRTCVAATLRRRSRASRAGRWQRACPGSRGVGARPPRQRPADGAGGRAAPRSR